MSDHRRPDFQQQVTDHGAWHADKRREWFKACARDAGMRGARWHSFHYSSGTLKYESWKRRPEAVLHISGPNGI